MQRHPKEGCKHSYMLTIRSYDMKYTLTGGFSVPNLSQNMREVIKVCRKILVFSYLICDEWNGVNSQLFQNV